MKSKLLFAVLSVAILFVGCKKNKTEIKLTNEKDSLSYSLGINIASSLQRGELYKELDLEILKAAVSEGIDTTADLKITQEDAYNFLNSYFEKKELKKYEKNKEEGLKFLEANKNQAGVVVLPSGVQYIELTKGNGPKPTKNDKVKVHYVGTLINGNKFDSSYDRGNPAEFFVSQVIPGWTEILQLMPVGSKWKVFIPQELAYGDNLRQGSPIEPYSTLIFEIELLSIEKVEASQNNTKIK